MTTMHERVVQKSVPHREVKTLETALVRRVVTWWP